MPVMVNGVQVDITALNNASPVIKQVAADIGGLETSAAQAGDNAVGASTGLDTMTISAQSLASAVAILTTGLTAMVTVFNWGEIASGNERLITSGEQLAVSYGSSLDQILASVKETSNGTVSEMDIIASSNKAMMLGVSGSAEQMGQLMEIAALRGRAMGISTTQAFDDMVRGIGRMSPMILDNLGIVVDADGTYGAYAESIGKSASELSRSEKIQALLNKVLQEGNKLLDDAGGLADDNASKYERWNAELDNTKNQLLENTLGMARFADMGASALASFQDVTEDQSLGEFFIANATGANLLNTALGFLEDRVASHNQISRDADAARWEGLASMYETVKAAGELSGAILSVSGADEVAVEGAIKVQEAYDKYNDTLSDLQIDHDELIAKKQELIEQGWSPESEKIQDVNDRLAENEQKQKDVTEAMKGTLDQMLINTAMAGLDADAQLALARATGQIDEEAYAALSAQQDLKKQYDDGLISAQEYADKTMALRDAISRLESKGITITIDAILNEIRNTIHNYTEQSANNLIGGGQAYAEGTDGWMTVPPGYPNDSYPVMMQSGERFAVIPAGDNAAPISGGMGGGNVYNLNVQIGNHLGDEENLRNSLYPHFIELVHRAESDGHIKSQG